MARHGASALTVTGPKIASNDKEGVTEDSTQHAEARDQGAGAASSDDAGTPSSRSSAAKERTSDVVAGGEPGTVEAATPSPSSRVVGAVARRSSLEGLEELLPEPDALVGTLVGERYRVTELIGRGGMGAVYRAEHVHMRKTVALKVLHREMTALDEVVARFEREAIVAGRIEHPNVVGARDFGRLEDGSFYLVLDYVEGRVLDHVLKDSGETFSVERVLNITGQIAEALQAAHAEGIVHRDLKPDNVMLIDRGNEPELVKVLDFGIAKMSIHEHSDTDRPITQAGTVFGTPEYMSPEQAAGQSVDHRGDLYSLGLLLYRMLAGRPPFTGEEVQAVLMMQITQHPPPLDRMLPPGIIDLLEGLLEKNPDDRIQSAEEVVQRVLDVLDADLTPSHSKTRAKLASISQTDLPRITIGQRLDAGALGKPLAVGAHRLPLWRVVAVAAAALAAGVVGVLVVFTAPQAEPSAEPTQRPVAEAPELAAPVREPVADADPELERLLARVFVGDKEAVAELERRPAEQRSPREWLALGRGLAKSNRLDEALAAYQTALEKQPSVAEDGVLRRDIWRALSNPETELAALRIAADHLGSHGADVLYKVWVETKDVTPATKLARELVYREDVRAAASPALQFLLAWREAIGCDDYSRLLPDATLHADRRALTLLKRAERRNECDLPEESLKAAVSAAQERLQPAPY